MDTKLARLKALWAAGDKAGALRIAAKFPRLGDKETAGAIRKGGAALANPAFYADMGYDPTALAEAAYAALAKRYELEG